MRRCLLLPSSDESAVALQLQCVVSWSRCLVPPFSQYETDTVFFSLRGTWFHEVSVYDYFSKIQTRVFYFGLLVAKAWSKINICRSLSGKEGQTENNLFNQATASAPVPVVLNKICREIETQTFDRHLQRRFADFWSHCLMSSSVSAVIAVGVSQVSNSWFSLLKYQVWTSHAQIYALFWILVLCFSRHLFNSVLFWVFLSARPCFLPLTQFTESHDCTGLYFWLLPCNFCVFVALTTVARLFLWQVALLLIYADLRCCSQFGHFWSRPQFQHFLVDAAHLKWWKTNPRSLSHHAHTRRRVRERWKCEATFGKKFFRNETQSLLSQTVKNQCFWLVPVFRVQCANQSRVSPLLGISNKKTCVFEKFDLLHDIKKHCSYLTWTEIRMSQVFTQPVGFSQTGSSQIWSSQPLNSPFIRLRSCDSCLKKLSLLCEFRWVLSFTVIFNTPIKRRPVQWSSPQHWVWGAEAGALAPPGSVFLFHVRFLFETVCLCFLLKSHFVSHFHFRARKWRSAHSYLHQVVTRSHSNPPVLCATTETEIRGCQHWKFCQGAFVQILCDKSGHTHRTTGHSSRGAQILLPLEHPVLLDAYFLRLSWQLFLPRGKSLNCPKGRKILFTRTWIGRPSSIGVFLFFFCPHTKDLRCKVHTPSSTTC